MPIPADQIDPDARKVLRRLVRHDYQAYLVGGCVRDLLLGRTPKDFDIATSATPNEVKNLFRNCRIIGRRFRLAHIFFGPKIIETATFRSNPRDSETGEEGEDLGERADNDLLIRRDNVFGTAEEDARRRDFTINGLFYDIENDEVIDYVGGLNDLAARTVRTIGDPEIRFREDPVRILRAIKFAARLSFDIEDQAWRAIREHQREIPKCAPPRVLEEIYRLLRGGAARRSMELLRDTGVLEVLLPELAELLVSRPGSTEASWLWRVLERLDALTERVPSNAVLLCVLLAPFVGDALFEDPPAAEGGARDLGQYVEDRTRPMLDRLRVSRRDFERGRQILLTQRRLAPSRRRRANVTNLLRRDYFEEALQVYELVGTALRPVASVAEDLTAWRRLQAGDSGEAPAIAGPTRRRRRRRRGSRETARVGNGSPANGSPGVQPPDVVVGGDVAREAGENGARDVARDGEDAEPRSPIAAAPVAGRQTSDAPPSTGSTTPER